MHSTDKHGRYLTSEAQVPGPPNLGGKTYFPNFFRPTTAGANRGQIFREKGAS